MRGRAHQALDARPQRLDVRHPAVGVQRLGRGPLLDEDELGVALSREGTDQVVADAAGLAAGGLEQVPEGDLHLLLLPGAAKKVAIT